MAATRSSRYVRVLFHDRGSDPETAWCVPLKAANTYRLDNILFLHSSPVYGDVVEARPGEDHPKFRRIIKASGRYAMIIDYPKVADFKPLSALLKKKFGAVTEGCFGPKGKTFGRLYLAVPKRFAAKQVFHAAQARVPGVVGVHPEFAGLPVDPGGRDRDEVELPLLFIAVRDGRTEMVRKLIKQGANVNDSPAPLFAAAMRNRSKEARLLLAAGARPERAKDRDGDPVLVTAAFRENSAVLRVLLTTNPKAEVKSLALLEAAGVGNLAICKLLLKHGADPKWTSRQGNSALSIARKKKQSAIVKLLTGR